MMRHIIINTSGVVHNFPMTVGGECMTPIIREDPRFLFFMIIMKYSLLCY